jgi:uncharacterized membrane protein YdbT with pleckstrin-like domain
MTDQPLAVYTPNVNASLGLILGMGIFMGLWAGIFFGAFGLVGATLVGLGEYGIFIGPLCGLVGLVGGVVYGYVKIRSMKYEIYDSSIRMTSGVLTTNIREIDVRNIDDVEYKESVFDGPFGTGTVEIEQEGDDDEFALAHIDDGMSVYEQFSQKF